MSRLWRLRCYGPPCLTTGIDGDTVLALAPKDAALLAYVALNNGGASARAATLVWPGATERGALNNLRQRLFRLRSKTEARLLEVSATACLADDLRVEPMPELAALEANANAWDAELLQGIDADDGTELAAWLSSERQAWAARRRDALAGLASACEAAGALVRALSHARRLLIDDPLSEHAHRRLMRLHYQRGDTASAVAAFEACEAALKDELGLKPSAETLALLQTIERGRPMEAASGHSPRPVPATLLRPPRAVGRQAERLQLAQAHAEGHIAALVGEAGMGKTRLLQDFVATQAHAVYAQARPGDAAVPYGAMARLLRALLAAAPAALAHAPRQELALVAPEWGNAALTAVASKQAPRLQAAIEQVVADALAAGVDTLVVDDLHFADPASVEMLRALVDADRLSGVRWAFAHRPISASDENGALLQALADSPRARWIVLAPLTDADLVELLDSLALPGIGAAEFAPMLAQHTGGNPLYVLETLREARLQPARAGAAASVALPRPQSIAHMIDRRLQRLSESARSLARVAALAGADFTPELAEHALGKPVLALASAWAELEAADVLRGNAFGHDLVRDGMLRATPRVIAVHAHRLIAGCMEGRKAEPARVAEHWLAGGEMRRAAAAFEQAADRARRASRPREQAALLLKAADAFAAVGDASTALVVRSQALRPLLHGEGFVAAQALSDRLIEAAGNGPGAGLVWTRRSSMLMNAGRADLAEIAGRKAHHLLKPDDLLLQVELLASLAIACVGRGKPDEGLELMRPWVDRIDDISDEALRIEFASAHAVVLYHLCRLDDAARALAKQIAFMRASGDVSELVPASLSLAALELRRGMVGSAKQHAMDAAAAQPDFDKPSILTGYTRALIGSALCGQAQFELGLAQLQEGREMLLQTAPNAPVQMGCDVAIAEVYLQLGQLARAQQMLANKGAAAEGVTPEGAGAARRALAMAAMLRQQGDRASAAFDSSTLAMLRKAGEYWWMLARIELAHRAEPTHAVETCEKILAEAQRNGDRVIAILAATLTLQVHCRAGNSGSAELAGLALLAENLLATCRSTLVYPPSVWLACFEIHVSCGRPDDASRCLREALKWIRQTALPHLPIPFQDAFLHRHPVNLLVQSHADRWADGALVN